MTTAGQRQASVQFTAYADSDAWTEGSAAAIAVALEQVLQERSRVRLLLSGGTTPAPVYRALSASAIAWPRIDVALVDERWLQPGDTDSNAHLVATHLLQDRAAAAHFQTLTRAGRSIDEAVRAANLHAHQRADVVVLGMGEDGHTASLFPRMRGLQEALESNHAYVPVDAGGCPGAGPWPRRISLTPAGLAPARARLMLIRGAGKRALLERAMDGSDPRELPVRIAFTTPGAPLQVHWCP